ncbi:hypothetical protein GQ43DRAFT_432661 [Delitschia confertaspora ATCC 74209]|uniref:DUF7732 domain-containing protein n=1 Tax=Delitschia confertaspora ATCC 74209 TaxID=1513339 RepID=A0A9P4JJK0_9PLEO|nr:hypothetical protein GQ43DRAFT_432661 [Delitschia confertaspora ATCC 74209]
MKPLHCLASLLWVTSLVNAVSIPETNALVFGNSEPPVARDILSPENALEKRKGGGGKGGGGGSGGGSKSGSGGGGSKSGGGTTKSGSGVRPAYGGGYYGGGASVPFSAGSRTPKGLLPGALLLPAAALLIFPGLWLYSVYPYHYNHPYSFRNRTVENATDGINQTLPVTCLCQEHSVCGCDENDNSTYLNDLIGNGSYAALNKTLVNVAMVDGNRTLVINGTLPSGTTAPSTSGSVAPNKVLQFSGYWAMVAIVISVVSFL